MGFDRHHRHRRHCTRQVHPEWSNQIDPAARGRGGSGDQRHRRAGGQKWRRACLARCDHERRRARAPKSDLLGSRLDVARLTARSQPEAGHPGCLRHPTMRRESLSRCIAVIRPARSPSRAPSSPPSTARSPRRRPSERHRKRSARS